MDKINFINRLTKEYDYSLLPDKVKSKSYVDIICKKHGVISIRSDVLLKGGICRKCAYENRSNKSIILSKFLEKYGNEYTYDISNYKNNTSKIKITCKKHGNFYISSIAHLNGVSCKKCKSENYKISNEDIDKRTNLFIEKAKMKYGEKYDYSKVKYTRSDSKVTIICKKHGEFNIRASNHLYSNVECKKCRFEGFSKKYTLTTEEFIKSSKNIHGNFYDYSNVEYINAKSKVNIICPNHGLFKQAPHEHKMGYGCPECNITIGERKISVILQKHNINYEFQKIFDDCMYINKLKFDFYLQDYNTCIEYDGIQHFEIVEYFGGEENFNKRKDRDRAKEKYCDDNNIFLLRIPYYINDIEKEILSILDIGF